MKIFKFISPSLFTILILFAVSNSFVYAQTDVNITGVVDNEDPTITITNPNNNATVSGTVNVTATAADDGGVVKVEFFVDGLPKHTDTTAPYTFSWDTRTVSNGSHIILARAVDIASKTAEDSVTVTIKNFTLESPSKKLTPLEPPTPGPAAPTKEERKFYIHIPFGFGEVIKAPFDFITANSNFLFGFLFALELLLLYWIVKKLRERKKKRKEEQNSTQTSPLIPKRNPSKS